jgi:hypothetical protein
MDLVIFGFVIAHVSRISRILKQPSGNGLLIGIGGTGRSSVTKLAAFIADFELFQIEVSKKYRLDSMPGLKYQNSIFKKVLTPLHPRIKVSKHIDLIPPCDRRIKNRINQWPKVLIDRLIL